MGKRTLVGVTCRLVPIRLDELSELKGQLSCELLQVVIHSFAILKMLCEATLQICSRRSIYLAVELPETYELKTYQNGYECKLPLFAATLNSFISSH